MSTADDKKGDSPKTPKTEEVAETEEDRERRLNAVSFWMIMVTFGLAVGSFILTIMMAIMAVIMLSNAALFKQNKAAYFSVMGVILFVTSALLGGAYYCLRRKGLIPNGVFSCDKIV